jgi:hypothetical protein
MGEIVRKPLRVRERSRRTFDQGLSLCFPRTVTRQQELVDHGEALEAAGLRG